MRRPTLTLAKLMGGIASLAVGIAALRYASPLWSLLLLGLVLGLLLVVPAGVIYRRGSRRAGWLGFGLFAGAFALTTLGPWATELRQKLPHVKLVSLLHEAWHPRPVATDLLFEALVLQEQNFDLALTSQFVDLNPAGVAEGGPDRDVLEPLRRWWESLTETGSPEAMQSVGQSLSTLLVGLVGMAAFRRFHATADCHGDRAGGPDLEP